MHIQLLHAGLDHHLLALAADDDLACSQAPGASTATTSSAGASGTAPGHPQLHDEAVAVGDLGTVHRHHLVTGPEAQLLGVAPLEHRVDGDDPLAVLYAIRDEQAQVAALAPLHR